MLQVLVIAVAFFVCDGAPLASRNLSFTPQQNDRALYIKIYSSLEIPQSDVSVLQLQLDEVGCRKVYNVVTICRIGVAISLYVSTRNANFLFHTVTGTR